ncbi:MAG: anti-sigma factor, partial [Lewinella sp.]|nr:anti-sigma factor [Lewinella sp.]
RREAAADRSTNGTGRAMPWVAILMAVLAAAAAFWFWRQNEASQGTSEQLRTVLAEVQDNCDEQAARLEAAEQQLGILRNPAFRPIIMAGTELAPTATATVYYNPEARQAYLDAGTLPATPSDKQYQLWAIVDGTPVSIGVFDALGQLATWQEVNFADNPQLFAVTLEPRGGSESPTLDAMYVAGEVL